ncbi:MAG: hypothetical protein Ct9H300mP5_0860 [Candidatus Pelagibacterales bacterium]|nr:MAG: hypothetical protein Ct9H300mP5_0860 [Pelagibacterales bacterium]
MLLTFIRQLGRAGIYAKKKTKTFLNKLKNLIQVLGYICFKQDQLKRN